MRFLYFNTNAPLVLIRFFRFIEPVFLLFVVCHYNSNVIRVMALCKRLPLTNKGIALSAKALKELQTSKSVFPVFFVLISIIR